MYTYKNVCTNKYIYIYIYIYIEKEYISIYPSNKNKYICIVYLYRF